MTKSPHFWWLISFLIFVILGLLTIIILGLDDSEKLLKYVAVCSTLISITLSVFAIQYTYHSNLQIQQQFEKINGAAENITGTSTLLSSTNNELKENLHLILSRIDTIAKSQEQTKKMLEDSVNREDIKTTTNNFYQPAG